MLNFYGIAMFPPILKVIYNTFKSFNVDNFFSFRCFERFFKHVNVEEGLLEKKENDTYILENINLIGYDYLWKVHVKTFFL